MAVSFLSISPTVPFHFSPERIVYNTTQSKTSTSSEDVMKYKKMPINDAKNKLCFAYTLISQYLPCVD